jgi:hypothetical protein
MQRKVSENPQILNPVKNFCGNFERKCVYTHQLGFLIQSAAEITPTFERFTVGSPKQIEGCGQFR